MNDHDKAMESVRRDMFYADLYRKQARAAESLGGLLNCETPGTVHEVSVKKGRWFQKLRGASEEPKEIVLSDDERREFARWCEERSKSLLQQAKDVETRVLKGEG